MTVRKIILWCVANTTIGGALGLIISLYLTGRVIGQIIFVSVLFGNAVGFTSGLSAMYILPLYRSLPGVLGIVLRALTLIAGGVLGTVVVFLANPWFVLFQSDFTFFIIAIDGLMALIVGSIIYSYERMRRELEGSYMELEMRRDIEEKLRELTALSELKALKAQINPHFFFNTLNTIAALIPIDQEKAEETVHDLADLFRYTLETAEREFVPLREELQFLDVYLRIERARFGDRLQVERSIDPESQRVRVPTLLLQPIVENALRHGIGHRKTGGTITIATTCEDEYCHIKISDDGTGIPKEKLDVVLRSGRGLKNVNERLLNLYKESSGVAIESTEGQGTTFILTIPRNRLEAKNEHENHHR
ncbi:MAG: histidine kinase [Gemmatimonadota bacterium]|nr:MAG: histidine kinase [Gemmatimonadota bacterium]